MKTNTTVKEQIVSQGVRTYLELLNEKAQKSQEGECNAKSLKALMS